MVEFCVCSVSLSVSLSIGNEHVLCRNSTRLNRDAIVVLVWVSSKNNELDWVQIYTGSGKFF